jgi:hypothetical protein
MLVRWRTTTFGSKPDGGMPGMDMCVEIGSGRQGMGRTLTVTVEIF